jgi:hypothetical protein
MSISHHIPKPTKNWIKDLNVRPETMKVLEENIKEMLQGVGQGKYFFCICKKDCIKLKHIQNICKKDHIN